MSDLYDPSATARHRKDDGSSEATASAPLVADKSRGVIQMEILASRLDTKYRILLYGAFALLAFTMTLDQYTARAYLTTATSTSFNAHSTLATISVIKALFQSVSQPPIAKLSDYAGRVNAYVLCVFFYALGYVIEASATNIYAYAIGNAIYIIGITGLFLLQNIIIADISSLRNRLFWSIFPSIPGTIWAWVSGNVVTGILATSSWRWGIGMFCILTPALATPIILTLVVGTRAHKVKPEAENGEKSDPVVPVVVTRSFKEKAIHIFWQLDVIGLVLLVGGIGLVLVTVTIANGKVSRWSDAHSIAMLVIGALGSVAFVLWEKFGARHPLLPFALLTNRTVIACIPTHPLASSASQLLTTRTLEVLVAANQSTTSALRITSQPSFVGTLTAVVAGVVTRYTRRLKPLIIFGFCVEILAIGLMIRYRTSTNSQAELAIVQVIRGFGVGCIGFPVQAAIQTEAKHEHVAAITASYLLIYYLSGGIGSAIGGGIWTNLVPQKLDAYMGNSTLAASAYGNPLGFIVKYKVGTPERAAVARAHDETQRIIVIVGLCVAVCGLIASLFIRNVRLPETQSLEDDDETVASQSTVRDAKSGH
ncbi:hypothetical protein RQP46_007734 [Phenoliferia psychrophenolica]